LLASDWLLLTISLNEARISLAFEPNWDIFHVELAYTMVLFTPVCTFYSSLKGDIFRMDFIVMLSSTYPFLEIQESLKM